MSQEKPFLNFQVDHMTLLLDPELYNVAYVIFRTVFGTPREEVLYEKRKEWEKGKGDVSMTFAVRIGRHSSGEDNAFRNAVIAVVQPSEPKTRPSHVREMLHAHTATAHWQHIALRTSDLIGFHKHATELGVNFITPILKDKDDDLIQVFSGEWYLPQRKPSGMFFEFVQRNPNAGLLKKLEERNRQSWFRDQTFLGLYAEKEKEYQSGEVTPFMDHDLFGLLHGRLKHKQLWEISEDEVRDCEQVMREYARDRGTVKAAR